MNSDATIVEGQGFVGIDVVFHDHNGVVLSTFSRRLSGYFSVGIAEMLAMREGLQLAANWNIHVDKVECDALQIVQSLSSSSPLVYCALTSLDIKSLFSNAVSFLELGIKWLILWPFLL